MHMDERRERCIAHMADVLDGTYQPLHLTAGMTVEHHANCSLLDDSCEFESCEIIKEDSRGNGWWKARFSDGVEALVHVRDLLATS